MAKNTDGPKRNDNGGNPAVRRQRAKLEVPICGHKQRLGVRCRKCGEVKKIEIRQMNGMRRVYGAFAMA